MSDTPVPEEGRKPNTAPLGVYQRPKPEGISLLEIAALILSILWLGGSAAYFLLAPVSGDGGGVDRLLFLMTMLVIFLPIALIWVAATAARATQVMRQESQDLQEAIEAIRQSHIAQVHNSTAAHDGAVARKLDEIAKVAHNTQVLLNTYAERTTVVDETPAPHKPEQTALELEPTSSMGGAPLTTEDFITALNFPETAEDQSGFAALHRALKQRDASQLLQSAQDVLTLLSQEGIYMDDLTPDRARPDLWRQFAHGVRGRSVAALGGIRDRSSLARTSTRMRQDPIFRDAAHHFLRLFDKSFVSFEETASDAEISALCDTRTARAFMLLGRVAGAFD